VARQEKTVDPQAGPLQAFAFALREVRTEAGSPPYRKLAKTAGYSAATLSEAASGVRKPTLDVVLAYVGACRGDVELWRKRWHELQVELAQSAPVEPESGAVVVEFEPAEPPPAEPPPARRGSPWRWKITVLAAVAVLLVGTVGAFAVWDPGKTDKTGCPPKLAHAAFTAATYGSGARVHTGAVRDAPVTETIPSGCTVGFVGYCLGDKIHDNTGGSPDIRWFKLPDGNVISSGVIHGNPPDGLPPSRCADDHPGPGTIALTVAMAGPETMRLSAKGTHLDIVGFAALYEPTADQPRRWRQVGFTEQTVDRPGFSVPWKVDLAAVAAGQDPVLIVAAGCLGGQGPTATVDARTWQPGGSGPKFPPVSLTPQELSAAAAAACSYPA
jgi:hypothetical protein